MNLKLDYETVINADMVQSVNFYPYYEPKDNILIAVCEIQFWFTDRPKLYFHAEAQRVYQYYHGNDYNRIWPKQINWS